MAAEVKGRKEKDKDKTTRLFDQVLVVGVHIPSPPDKPIPKPSIKYQFPPGPEAAALSMAQFCLPDLDVLQASSEREPEKFSFVLTESDGTRRFGLVLRHLPPPPPSERHPVCFCVVSCLACYAMFDQLLGVVQAKWALSASAVTLFLEAVRDTPVPAPGASCLVRAPSTRGAHTEQYRLARPAEGEHLLEHLDYAELFRASAPQPLISIFASLLCERRVVFVSQSLAVLSNFVQGMVALLHPFSWQYIYIPVLPKALLSFVCAPMPFVVGVLAAHLPEVKRLGPAMDEVLLFDIDADKFLAKPFDDRKLLVPALQQPLVSDLERFAKSARKKKDKKEPAIFRREVGDAFVSFFLELLGSYTSYLRIDDITGTASFDRDEMVRVAPEALRELLNQVLGTQMFDCFIREREEVAAKRGQKSSLPLGPFEQRVYMLAQMERALARSSPVEAEALREAMASVRRPKPPKKSKMAVLSALVGQATTSLPLSALDPTSSSSSSTVSPVISRPLPSPHSTDDVTPLSPGRSQSPQLSLRHPSPRAAANSLDEQLSPRSTQRAATTASSNSNAPSNNSSASPTSPTSSAAPKARVRGQRQAMVLTDRALEQADDDVFALLARRPNAPTFSVVPPTPSITSTSTTESDDSWTAASAPPRSPRPGAAAPTASTPMLSMSRSSRGGTTTTATPTPPSSTAPAVPSSSSNTSISSSLPSSSTSSSGNLADSPAALAALLGTLTREEVECWSVDDTAKWAADIGQSAAAGSLRAHAIDGLVLLDLDARDLDELALPTGASTALLRYIDHWRRRRN